MTNNEKINTLTVQERAKLLESIETSYERYCNFCGSALLAPCKCKLYKQERKENLSKWIEWLESEVEITK